MNRALLGKKRSDKREPRLVGYVLETVCKTRGATALRRACFLPDSLLAYKVALEHFWPILSSNTLPVRVEVVTLG